MIKPMIWIIWFIVMAVGVKALRGPDMMLLVAIFSSTMLVVVESK